MRWGVISTAPHLPTSKHRDFASRAGVLVSIATRTRLKADALEAMMHAFDIVSIRARGGRLAASCCPSRHRIVHGHQMLLKPMRRAAEREAVEDSAG